MNTIGDHTLQRGGSLTPSSYPDEVFELYSIPAHDRGGADLLPGAEIGSSKQLVRPGDVLLSKIIPHIRRVRVVGSNSGHRQIASGEWIVLRTEAYDPSYLRHFLLSDGFHEQFMNTVAGVGGSLVRARPQFVKQIPAPLPSIEEQRRIAAILDQADAIRAKRRQVLTHLDACTDALFRSVVATSDAPLARLAEVADFFGGASLPAGEPFEGQTEGTILMKVSDMNAPGNARYIMGAAGWTPSATPVASTVSGGSVILPKRGGAIGTNKKRIATRRTALDPNLMGVTAREGVLNPSFLFAWFRTFDLASITSGSSVPQLNKKDLAPLTVPLPPMSVQVQFAHKLAALERLTSVASEAQNQDEDLFSSLQSRAFRGEL